MTADIIVYESTKPSLFSIPDILRAGATDITTQQEVAIQTKYLSYHRLFITDDKSTLLFSNRTNRFASIIEGNSVQTYRMPKNTFLANFGNNVYANINGNIHELTSSSAPRVDEVPSHNSRFDLLSKGIVYEHDNALHTRGTKKITRVIPLEEKLSRLNAKGNRIYALTTNGTYHTLHEYDRTDKIRDNKIDKLKLNKLTGQPTVLSDGLILIPQSTTSYIVSFGLRNMIFSIKHPAATLITEYGNELYIMQQKDHNACFRRFGLKGLRKLRMESLNPKN